MNMENGGRGRYGYDGAGMALGDNNPVWSRYGGERYREGWERVFGGVERDELNEEGERFLRERLGYGGD